MSEKFRVQVLNHISARGLRRLSWERFAVSAEVDDPHAILLRSADLHTRPIPESVLAIGRAGSGTNNIPVSALSRRGVPVFNAPGANANAVKELEQYVYVRAWTEYICYRPLPSTTPATGPRPRTSSSTSAERALDAAAATAPTTHAQSPPRPERRPVHGCVRGTFAAACSSQRRELQAEDSRGLDRSADRHHSPRRQVERHRIHRPPRRYLPDARRRRAGRGRRGARFRGEETRSGFESGRPRCSQPRRRELEVRNAVARARVRPALVGWRRRDPSAGSRPTPRPATRAPGSAARDRALTRSRSTGWASSSPPIGRDRGRARHAARATPPPERRGAGARRRGSTRAAQSSPRRRASARRGRASGRIVPRSRRPRPSCGSRPRSRRCAATSTSSRRRPRRPNSPTLPEGVTAAGRVRELDRELRLLGPDQPARAPGVQRAAGAPRVPRGAARGRARRPAAIWPG